jgi:hypothetical protein
MAIQPVLICSELVLEERARVFDELDLPANMGAAQIAPAGKLGERIPLVLALDGSTSGWSAGSLRVDSPGQKQTRQERALHSA